MSPRRTRADDSPRPKRRRSSSAARRSGGKPKRPTTPETLEVPVYLRKLGVQPRKALGQHFLIDELILGDIAAACRLQPGDTALEIGAGPGGLTEELAKTGATIVAVELDEELAAATRRRLEDYEHLHLIAADILDFEPEELLAEVDAAPPYVAVGNLPYYITQPIVRRLLESDPGPERIVVLVQREVAQRMAGGPGRESLLSLSVQVYGEARVLFDVPATAFWPPPKVQSAVVEITRLPQRAVDFDDEALERFFHLLRAGFAQPRKQIHNVFPEELGLEPEQVLAVIESTGIDPIARAQHLTLADWERLYRGFEAQHPEALDVR